MTSILLLNEQQLYQLGANDPLAYMDIIEDVFVQHATGQYVQPLKSYLRWDDNKNRMNLMPSALTAKQYNVIGVKSVTSVPSNPHVRQIPRGQSLLLLYSLENGLPLALLAGSKISAMRTAMITTVAAKYLANPNSRRIGLIGAGPIAAHHLLCLKAVFPSLKEASVFDVDHERTMRFCKQVGNTLDIHIVPVKNYQSAITDHDIVIAATNVNTAFIDGQYLSQGTFFANVGIMEAEVSVIEKSQLIVVDDINQCTQKDCPLTRALAQNILKRDDIIEMGKLIAKQQALPTRNLTVFFNAIGMGMFDAACGNYFLKKAHEKNCGQWIKIDNGFYNEFGLLNEPSVESISE